MKQLFTNLLSYSKYVIFFGSIILTTSCGAIPQHKMLYYDVINAIKAAIDENNEQALLELVTHDPDTNQIDWANAGNVASPLRYACATCRKVKILRILFDRTDLNIEYPDHETPLTWAVHNNNDVAVSVLVDCRKKLAKAGLKLFPVNVSASFYDTLLHQAVMHKNTALVEALLSFQDINIDVMNKQCQTPLHQACLLGDPKVRYAMVALFVCAGADINTFDGHTSPLKLAYERYPDLIVIMLSSKWLRTPST